jgi:hypothetical protein
MQLTISVLAWRDVDMLAMVAKGGYTASRFVPEAQARGTP